MNMQNGIPHKTYQSKFEFFSSRNVLFNQIQFKKMNMKRFCSARLWKISYWVIFSFDTCIFLLFFASFRFLSFEGNEQHYVGEQVLHCIFIFSVYWKTIKPFSLIEPVRLCSKSFWSFSNYPISGVMSFCIICFILLVLRDYVLSEMQIFHLYISPTFLIYSSVDF